MIQDLIKTKPASATRAMGAPKVSADTVYFDLEVRVPQPNHPGYPRILVYNVEVHYHPVPTSANYLHVKRTAASDPGNTVQLNNWLIDLGILRQGRQAWDGANPKNLSPHTF
jgi:hypothetical protein